MSLAPREKRTILIGSVIIVLVVGWTGGLRPLLNKRRASTPAASQQVDRFAQACDQIERLKQVRADLAKLTDDLHVEVPAASPLEQMKDLVEKFESLAGRAQVKITNLTELRSRARTSTTRAGERTEMKLDLTCSSLVSLVRFIDGLEEMPAAIAFDQLSITTGGGRSDTSQRGESPSSRSGPSRGGGPPSEGPPGRGGRDGGGGGGGKIQMQATLRIHTYLFPDKVQQ